MRRRCGRTPGRNPLQLTGQKWAAVVCFYANASLQPAEIAAALGMSTCELRRALRLNAGKRLINLLFGNVEPHDLWPDFQITEPGVPPPGALEPPALLPMEDSRGPSCEEVLKQLGFGPRNPEDETDA